MKLRSDGLTWREIDGEMVILDLASSTYLKTNETGATLMRMLVQERTLEELVDGLTEEFGIDDERARADTEAFVQTLRARGLLAT